MRFVFAITLLATSSFNVCSGQTVSVEPEVHFLVRKEKSVVRQNGILVDCTALVGAGFLTQVFAEPIGKASCKLTMRIERSDHIETYVRRLNNLTNVPPPFEYQIDMLHSQVHISSRDAIAGTVLRAAEGEEFQGTTWSAQGGTIGLLLHKSGRGFFARAYSVNSFRALAPDIALDSQPTSIAWAAPSVIGVFTRAVHWSSWEFFDIPSGKARLRVENAFTRMEGGKLVTKDVGTAEVRVRGISR